MSPFLPVSCYFFFLSLLKFSSLQQSFVRQSLGGAVTICRVKLWPCPSRNLSCCHLAGLELTKVGFASQHLQPAPLQAGPSTGMVSLGNVTPDVQLWHCCLCLQLSPQTLQCLSFPSPSHFLRSVLQKQAVPSCRERKLSLDSF